MDINYNDLNFCLNMLYDYVYNKKTDECYIFEPIALRGITIDELKKKYVDYEKILNSKTKYLYEYQDKFIFKRYPNKSTQQMEKQTGNVNYSVNITICKYDIFNKNLDDLNRKEIMQIKILYLLSELVINEDIPYILLPIMNFDIKYEELKKINGTITNVIPKYSDDDTMLISLTEHYYKMTNLEEYIKTNKEKLDINFWKILFFQILLTLHKIYEKIKDFRIGTLTPQTIWVYEKKNNDFKLFVIDGIKYKIPESPIEIKLSYFYDSTISEQNINNYYDFFYFSQTLIYLLENIDYRNNELDIFLENIIPMTYRIKKNNFLKKIKDFNETIIYKNPKDVIKKNNFFKLFISNMNDSEKSDISGSSMEIKPKRHISSKHHSKPKSIKRHSESELSKQDMEMKHPMHESNYSKLEKKIEQILSLLKRQSKKNGKTQDSDTSLSGGYTTKINKSHNILDSIPVNPNANPINTQNFNQMPNLGSAGFNFNPMMGQMSSLQTSMPQVPQMSPMSQFPSMSQNLNPNMMMPQINNDAMPQLNQQPMMGGSKKCWHLVKKNIEPDQNMKGGNRKTWNLVKKEELPQRGEPKTYREQQDEINRETIQTFLKANPDAEHYQVGEVDTLGKADILLNRQAVEQLKNKTTRHTDAQSRNENKMIGDNFFF